MQLSTHNKGYGRWSTHKNAQKMKQKNARAREKQQGDSGHPQAEFKGPRGPVDRLVVCGTAGLGHLQAIPKRGRLVVCSTKHIGWHRVRIFRCCAIRCTVGRCCPAQLAIRLAIRLVTRAHLYVVWLGQWACCNGLLLWVKGVQKTALSSGVGVLCRVGNRDHANECLQITVSTIIV
jgi:hypothetical protein